MAFPDMLNRIEQFGSRAHTRNALMSFRDRERDRIIVSDHSKASVANLSNTSTFYLQRDELGGRANFQEESAEEHDRTMEESSEFVAGNTDYADFDELELVRIADEAEQRLKLMRKD
jgi:hypothetical protein